MGKSLLAAGTLPVTSVANNRFFAAGAGSQLGTNATETNRRVTARIAGDVTLFGVNVGAPAASAAFKFRKNAGNGNQTVSPGGAGFTADATHTDSLAAGDTFDAAYTSGGSATNMFAVRAVFAATSGHSSYHFGLSGSTVAAGSTAYFSAAGNGTNTATEANAQAKHRAAGDIKNLQVNVSTNVATSASTVTVRKNGAGGNNTLSVAAGATGTAEDTAHTDAIVSGDLVAIQVVNGGGGVLGIQNIGFTFTATAGSLQNDIFATNNTSYAVTTTTYLPITGGQGNTVTIGSTTEADAQIQHGFKCKMDSLRAFVSANTKAGATTLRTRVNAGNGNQSISIGAGATGWVEDSSNFDMVAASDNVALQISGGTSGALTITVTAIRETDATESGTGALALRHVSIAGTGVEKFTGTGALALRHVSIAGTGLETIPGSGALALPHARVSGSGAETESGSGALALKHATISGSGAEAMTGSGALVLGPARVAGAGTETIPGAGALTLHHASLSGSGSEADPGSAAVVLPHATVSGTGLETAAGSGALTLPSAAIDGSGAEAMTGSGALTLGHAILAGSGTQTAAGSGASGTLEIFEEQDRAAFIARRKTRSGRLPSGGTGLDRRIVGTLTIHEPQDRAEFEAVALPADRRIVSIEAADVAIFFAASVVEASSRIREAGDRAEMSADFLLWADYDQAIMEMA